MWIRFLVLLSAAVWSPAATLEYDISPSAGNEFALDVAKTGLYNGKKHRFLFERYHGRIQFDRESPVNATVQIAIESASAVCTDTWVKVDDVKKIQTYAVNEMLQATTFPTLTFRSSRIKPLGETQYDVEGLLTIRDVVKPVLVTVNMEPASQDTLQISGGAEIKLRDFGLKPPSAGLGLIGTKNEMALHFRLTAHQR